MTLPDIPTPTIVRLAAAGGDHLNRNLYMCPMCKETQWGKDNEPIHEEWRAKHRNECFMRPALKVVPEYVTVPTETEFQAAYRRGEVYGVTIDMSKKRNRPVRFRKA